METIYPRTIGRRFVGEIDFPEAPYPMKKIFLWQFGEYDAVPDYCAPSHKQYCFEISGYLDGSGSMIIDGKEYKGTKGSVFVIPESTVHQVKSASDSHLRLFFFGFSFREEECQTYPFNEILSFFKQEKVYAGSDNVNLIPIIQAALAEVYNSSPGFEQAIENYAELLLILTWRNFTVGSMSMMPSAYAYNALQDKPTIYAIVRYIDDHIGQVDTRTLADELGFNYAYLSHMFSVKAGITLREYVKVKKMEYACTLIKQGKTNIEEIASLCGYENRSAFSRAFKQAIGTTPSSYIQRVRT